MSTLKNKIKDVKKEVSKSLAETGKNIKDQKDQIKKKVKATAKKVVNKIG
jgi:hypothetical protein